MGTYTVTYSVHYLGKTDAVTRTVNVDSTDASGNNIPASKLISSMKENCDSNTFNVILMHDSDAKSTTAEALPRIIEWGKEQGYRFKAMTKTSTTIHHDVNN